MGDEDSSQDGAGYGYHPIPQPEDVPIREREDSMGAYLMMFAAMGAGLPLPIMNLVAAIIYYVVHKDKPRFVKYHTLHSLLAQIPVTLLNAGLIFWTIRNLIYENSFTDLFLGYLSTVVLANLIYTIFSIIAAIKARRGRFYYFVFFGRLAFDIVYSIKDEGGGQKAPVNRPPS